MSNSTLQVMRKSPYTPLLVLITLAILKFLDLAGFANGFQKYDLLGKRSRSYAISYPFIELTLSLAYLSQYHPRLTYFITGFGAIGVITALERGLDVDYACLDTSLRVPLSTVALTEDLGMATMALLMFHTY